MVEKAIETRQLSRIGEQCQITRRGAGRKRLWGANKVTAMLMVTYSSDNYFL